jgi:hypothetical protein
MEGPRTKTLTRASLSGLAVLLVACSGGTQKIAPEHPDLTGTWVINLEQSDRPGDLTRRERPPRAPAGRRGRAGGERR